MYKVIEGTFNLVKKFEKVDILDRGVVVLKNKILLTLLFLTFFSINSDAQFGKNKVQYDEHEWVYLKSQHFDVYFYQGGDYIADFAAKVLEGALDELQTDFGYSIKKRLPIMIYKSHNHFQQTNVVQSYMEEGIGGVTESFKNRMVVPFESDYEQFRHVLHHELMHAYVNDMIYGGSVQSIISGAIRLQLPLWFGEGMAEYVSQKWETRADMILRDGTIHGYMNYISPYQQGMSLMRYIASVYGKEKVSDILRRINITKDLNRGFVSALGIDLEELAERWELAMKRQYWPDITDRANPDEFATRLTDHNETKNFYNVGPTISPAGDVVSYITDKNGYNDIYLVSAINGETIGKVMGGQRKPALEELKWLTPGMSWSPDGEYLALSVKAGDQDALTIINTALGDMEQHKFDLDGVFDADWSPLGDEIAFTGTKDGATDIYAYHVETGELRRITADYYADKSPHWSPDGSKLLFVSDRKNSLASYKGGTNFDELEKIDMINHDYKTLDIYMMNSDGTGITRLTDNKEAEGFPLWSPDGDQILYTSEENGISNIYVMDLESGDNYPITNILTGAFQLSMDKDASKLVFSSYYQAGFDVYMIKNPFEQASKAAEISNTVFFEERLENLIASDEEQSLTDRLSEEEKPSVQDDLSQYIFDDRARRYVEKIKESKEEFLDDPKDYTEEDGSFSIKKYKLKFSPDIVAGQYAYDTFFGMQGTSVLQFSDMLGNHTVQLGTDLYIDLKNSNYSMMYAYLPKKTDYYLGFSNFANFFSQIVADPVFGYSSLTVKYRNSSVFGYASRPFSKFTRIDAGLNYSNFGVSYLSPYYDDAGYSFNVISSSFSWVKDTTLWGMIGPVDGSRSRLSFTYSPEIGDKQKRVSFVTMSGDFRQYKRIKRDYSLALRLSGGVSNGERPETFFLGGVPNWLNRKFDADMQTDVRDIFFSQWISPLRGSGYYSLMGSRYALMNAEFRFPFIRQMELGWPLRLRFSNILGAMFVDAGSAWFHNDFNWTEENTDPYGREKFDNLRVGYGIGTRIYMLGMLLRTDIAWNYDYISHSKPMYIISFGGDW